MVIEAYDWTVETLVRGIQKSRIDNSLGSFCTGHCNTVDDVPCPSAWDLHEQRLFVDSVARGLPLPQVVLVESARKSGSRWLVLDGWQRLRALSNFYRGDLGTLVDLSEVENVPLRTVIVKPKTWGDTDLLRQTYDRTHSTRSTSIYYCRRWAEFLARLT